MEIIIFTIILLVILREGFQHRDRIKSSKRLSGIWHFFGLLTRGLIFVLLYMMKTEVWLLTLSAVLMWPIYNIACSLGRKQKWYYVGTRGIDGIIRKLLPFIKFDK